MRSNVKVKSVSKRINRLAKRSRHRMTLSAMALMLAACGGGGDPSSPTGSATPQSLCSAFTNKAFVTADGTATITSATWVAASNNNPEYCSVKGSMAPSLNFEVKLPTNWNQRVLAIGGGGFDGAIPQPAGYQLQQQYVTVASDGGHQAGADESWALDAEKLNDYAYRSAHKTLGAARLIVQQRYNQSATRTYFEGCSNGGREALIQAQRYPDDYDGIVARAPAYNFTSLMLAGHSVNQQFFASAASQLSNFKIATLSAAVLFACDALDGVNDFVVSNVNACYATFKPESLLCPTGTDTDACLTPAQVATVKKIYSPFALNLTPPVTYYIGWPAGGESDLAGWPYWMASPTTGAAYFPPRFIQYFLLQNPVGFVPENNLPIIVNRSQLIDANSTDYTAFRAHNGKLILWHGTTDWAISYLSTALYYNNVVTAAGSQAVADQFMEFFPAPGVQHCSGGNGPDFVDLLTPVRNWVESGTPPSQQNLNIVKLNLSNLSIVNSRPLCKYPKYPRYTGSGDPNAASNFTCM